MDSNRTTLRIKYYLSFLILFLVGIDSNELGQQTERGEKEERMQSIEAAGLRKSGTSFRFGAREYSPDFYSSL